MYALRGKDVTCVKLLPTDETTSVHDETPSFKVYTVVIAPFTFIWVESNNGDKILLEFVPHPTKPMCTVYDGETLMSSGSYYMTNQVLESTKACVPIIIEPVAEGVIFNYINLRNKSKMVSFEESLQKATQPTLAPTASADSSNKTAEEPWLQQKGRASSNAQQVLREQPTQAAAEAPTTRVTATAEATESDDIILAKLKNAGLIIWFYYKYGTYPFGSDLQTLVEKGFTSFPKYSRQVCTIPMKGSTCYNSKCMRLHLTKFGDMNLFAVCNSLESTEAFLASL